MTTFSEQFPIVFQALNVGFLQTLKLFAITLIGAIPLGLIIAFGSMSNWAAFGFLRPVVLKHVNPRELTWWQKVQVWFVTDLSPCGYLPGSSSGSCAVRRSCSSCWSSTIFRG